MKAPIITDQGLKVSPEGCSPPNVNSVRHGPNGEEGFLVSQESH
jgi:hypothetical protein